MVNDMSKYIEAVHARLSGSRGDPHLLREVVRLHQVMMAGFARRTGMTASRFALMRLVAHAEDAGVGVMDLARLLGINAAAVTRQVKEMEEDGLVRRRADATDGRRSHVRLSPKGRDTFETIHGRAHDLERALAAAVGPEEMKGAARTLATLRRAVEALTEGHGQ
jgi:DNA-binding MarR family transcriptional regulator